MRRPGIEPGPQVSIMLEMGNFFYQQSPDRPSQDVRITLYSTTKLTARRLAGGHLNLYNQTTCLLNRRQWSRLNCIASLARGFPPPI